MELAYSVTEISQIAKMICEHTTSKILLFEGQMGAGKTTLIKHIVSELGVSGTTSSPTFSLVNEYQTIDNQIIYHFDLYRLKNQSEALDMGIEDYLFSGNYCFIEWPELIKELLPEEHSVLSITPLADGRRMIKIQ